MSERLEAIHQQMTTDSETVQNVIHDLWTGQKTITRIVAGETNEVYDVNIAGHPPVILRIKHDSAEGDFNRELWALDKAKEAQVPVPTVLKCGVIADVNKSYMIQEKIQGSSLDALLTSATLPLDTAQSITEEAGRLLGRLHAIQTKGFGDLDEKGKGAYRTLSDWFSIVTADTEKFTDVITAAGFNTTDADTLFQLLETNGHTTLQPHLIHDDFAPKHILVKDGGIAGIIDFELAKSGYLGFELPEWELRHRSSLPITWLLQGYQQERGSGVDEQPYQKACRAFKSFVLLDYYTNESPDDTLRSSCTISLKDLLRS